MQVHGSTTPHGGYVSKKLNLNDAFGMQSEPDSLDSMITVLYGYCHDPIGYRMISSDFG